MFNKNELLHEDPHVEILWDDVPEGGFPEEFETNGGKWGPNGSFGTSGGTVTWSLPSAGITNQTSSSSFFTGSTVNFGSIVGFDFQAVIQSAFDAWAAVADIDFVQVADGGGNVGVGTNADIRIVAGFIDGNLPGGDVLAKAFLPAPGNGSSSQGATAGDIVMDSAQNWNQNLFFLTMVHEIGHSIGLRHSSVFPAIMQPTINTSLNGLQPDDVAGVRAIYGTGGPPPDDDFAGDTTTSGTISVNGTASGDVEFSGDSDWFAISLSAGVQYTFDLEGSPTGGGSLSDPFLRLHNSVGSQLVLDDDGGTGLNSKISFTPTTSDTYFLAAEAYAANTGTYTLTASSAAGQSIDGTAGNDPMLFGTNLADTINGFAGDDILAGFGGDDILNGGAGDDMLIGSFGADTIDGGTGSDTASYFNSTGAVQINLNTGTATGGEAAGDTLTNVENLIGSSASDTLTGNGAANVLSGGAGVDTLDGGLNNDQLLGQVGNDILISSLGADFMSGGFGTDLVDYSGSNAAIQAKIGGTNTGGHAQGDNLFGVENIDGSMFGDTIIGSNLTNVLNGGDGNDVLFGASKGDILNGGEGNDTLIGGSGGDQINGGNGVDTANYFSSFNGVHVDLQAGMASLGDATGDTLTGIENLIGSHGLLRGGISGNPDDRLTGNSLANELNGYDGADWLKGGVGDDLLFLGSNDGDADRAIYDASGFGNDTVVQFENGIDILDVRGLGVSFGDVNIAGGANATITFDGVSGQITLINFAAADIDTTDFFF